MGGGCDLLTREAKGWTCSEVPMMMRRSTFWKSCGDIRGGKEAMVAPQPPMRPPTHLHCAPQPPPPPPTTHRLQKTEEARWKILTKKYDVWRK